MLKEKFFVFITTFIFIFSSFNISYAVGEEKNECDGELLKSLDIIDQEDDFLNDGTVTRGQLARIAARLINGGNKENISGNDIYISDVKKEDEYYDEICCVVNMGFMTVTEDGKFLFDEAVNCAQTAKVLMSVLGYREVAENKGGYPEGYLYFAYKNGLFDDMNITADKLITVSEIIKTVENSLEIKMMKKSLIKNVYETSDNSLLENVFDLRTVDGIFSKSNVLSQKNTSIYIDKTRYEFENYSEDYDELIGCKVRAYITRTTKKVVYIDGSKHMNYKFRVYSDDIVKISGGRLVYKVSQDKNQTIDISLLKLYYNEEEQSYNENLFFIKNGYITFIGEAKNDYYCAVVTGYEIMTVGKISNKRILDYFNDSVNINTQDGITQYHFYLDNEAVDLTQIEKYDFMKLYFSSDRSLCNVTVVRDTLRGEFTQNNDDSIVINTMEYKKSDYFKKTNKLNVGDEARFIVDNDYVIGGIKEDDLWKYGYLTDIKSFGNLDKRLMMRIFTQKNLFEEIQIKDKIILNGETVISDDENTKFSDAFKHYVSYHENELIKINTRNIVRQIIKYKLEDGKISAICTADFSDYNDDKLSIDCKEKTYMYKGSYFIEAYCVDNEKSKIFYVPYENDNTFDGYGNVNEALRNSNTDDDYFCGTANEILKNDKEYKISAFDVTEGGLSKCIIVNNSSGAANKRFTSTQSKIILVDKLSKMLNKSGDIVYAISGYQQSKYVHYCEAKEDILIEENEGVKRSPSCGDVIQVDLNMNNEITAFSLRYDLSENVMNFDKVENGTVYGAASGNVYSYDEYGVRLYKNDVLSKKTYSLSGVENIYVFSREESKAKIGTVNSAVSYKQFEEASFMFVRTQYGIPTEIVIYND